jgi:hypothetical protein
MIKFIANIDSALVMRQYSLIEEHIHWVDILSKGKQASLQYADAYTENLWADGTGSLAGLGGSGGLVDITNPELKYNNLNPLLLGTIFEEIIEQYKLVRSLFMWINSMSCYSIHRDLNPRIHIPIITNPECFFVFKEDPHSTIEHLTTGKVYWTDTRKMHTFINCSREPRLHLIGVVTE